MSNPTLRQNTIRINGRSLALDGTPVQTTLLDFLRDHGLTGAKEGCAEGECGACMVAMVASHGSGSAYKAVNSCLLFASAAADREFFTVEGLAQNGQLAEAQSAMAAAGGSQCGYCTPGFVVSLFAEQYRPGRSGACHPHALGGNLCRCTGYRPIRDAAATVGPPESGYFLDRLSQPAPTLHAVDYHANHARLQRPRDLAECLSMISHHPSAKLISGGTDLAVESNLRFRRWNHLISLEGIHALREFADNPDAVRIGAALPLGELERLWTGAPGVVHAWLELFASPQIRNRATLGGNLASASPIGDSAPILMALNATLHVIGIQGSRCLPLASFFTGYRETNLAADELILAIEIPKPFPLFTRFYKASKRRMDDISTVAAGLSINLDAAGRIQRAIFAFGGVAASPLRAVAAEELALGKPWNLETVELLGRELDQTLNPMDDHRGSAAYRKAMARNFIAKFHHAWTESQA